MRKIGIYLAVAGLLAGFGACNGEKREFGADGNMAAAGQTNTGGAKSGGAPASVGGAGGASGAGMLMVVKVPCQASPECDDKNPCNGVEICAAGFCAAEGTNKADGSACMAPPGTAPVSMPGTGGAGGAGGAGGPTLISPSDQFFCTKGSCARGYCGDGYADALAGEECDDADADDADGCSKDCQFTCESDAECDNGNFCDGTEICLPATHTCATGVKPADKTICNPPESTKECRQGTCVVIGCGDGAVTTVGEECDDGNVTPNDGCEIDCQWTCESDLECSDQNACNGTETCDVTTHLCKPGVAVVVSDDANPCTDDVCDPVDGQSLHTLKDPDGDGEASTALGTCGTDCNDADGAIFSGSQEICGDGKDNDCNPTTGDMDSSTRYYLDCDGDGFATDPSNYVSSCGYPPPPRAGLCPQGSYNGWTTTEPDPKSPKNWDCNDQDVRVSPLQTQYFADYYTSPISRVASWDYDCDGKESPYETIGGIEYDYKLNPCDSSCSPQGYYKEPPSCGGQGIYSYCIRPAGPIFYPPITRAQSTIILPPIYVCDFDATVRKVEDYHTQTCR
ncbi:MAG: MopE-related protein [Polyangiaceae bacterium]|nr:MopE-related protein [Polyangiaceae bacterium]